MNRKDLSEANIKAKFIPPAILKSSWDEQTQLGREIFTENNSRKSLNLNAKSMLLRR